MVTEFYRCLPGSDVFVKWEKPMHECAIVETEELHYDNAGRGRRHKDYVAICLETEIDSGGAACDTETCDLSYADEGENAVLRSIRYLNRKCTGADHDVVNT